MPPKRSNHSDQQPRLFDIDPQVESSSEIDNRNSSIDNRNSSIDKQNSSIDKQNSSIDEQNSSINNREPQPAPLLSDLTPLPDAVAGQNAGTVFSETLLSDPTPPPIAVPPAPVAFEHQTLQCQAGDGLANQVPDPENSPEPHPVFRIQPAQTPPATEGLTSACDDLENTDRYLPARMLNEFTYCPRLFYLEHVEGLFADNADTTEGSVRHKRVDQERGELPSASRRGGPEAATKKTGRGKRSAQAVATEPADDVEDAAAEAEKLHARSIMLAADEFGIIAKLDVVEAQGNLATPVDYKRGSPKKLADGSITAWEPEAIQLCAQALVLRANGYQCERGVIYFCETKQRVEIPITEALIESTRLAIVGARETAEQLTPPPPLDSSPKCPRCSLVGICLPDETMACKKLDGNGQSLEQPLLFNIGVVWTGPRGETIAPSEPTRALVSSRDSKRPLYLNSQGLYIGKSGEVLQIKQKDSVIETVRLHDVSQVNLFGNIQITTQALQTLLQLEIPVVYFSMGGWFYGMTQGVGLKNIMWRREQFRMADSPAFCLRLAKQIVSSKIRNQRTLLMRNHLSPPADALRFLKVIGDETERASGLEQLLGLEGLAARTYFENFAGMIKVGQADDPNLAPWDEVNSGPPPWLNFHFKKRNRRPPRDPVNALLSLGYSLLAKDLTVTCASVGLDPFLGFYHQPRFGRPSLALDLMEMFRPLIVDSAVLSAINMRMVQPEHFRAAADAVALTPEGRRNFFRAYEQRMDQLVTHPLFGYRVSYRRVLEIQTRLLARVLTGEIKNYPTFETR